MLYPDATSGAGVTTSPVLTYAASLISLWTTPQKTVTRVVTQKTVRATATAAGTVKDQSGTTLIANDSTGFGLKRPYLEWHAYPTAQETTPVDSTSSGSFVSLVTVSNEPQHPRIRVRVRAVTGAATSGEVRLVDRATGQVIAGPLVVGLATAVESNLEGALVAPTLSGGGAPMRVDVQARTTAGANTIGVLVMHAVGVGT